MTPGKDILHRAALAFILPVLALIPPGTAGAGRVPPLEGPSIRLDFGQPFIERSAFAGDQAKEETVIPRLDGVSWTDALGEGPWERAAPVKPGLPPGSGIECRLFYNESGLFFRARALSPETMPGEAGEGESPVISLRVPVEILGQARFRPAEIPENPVYSFALGPARPGIEPPGNDAGLAIFREEAFEVTEGSWAFRIMVPFRVLGADFPPPALEVAAGREAPPDPVAGPAADWPGDWKRVSLEGVTGGPGAMTRRARRIMPPEKPGAAFSGRGVRLEWTTGRARSRDRWVEGRVILDRAVFREGDRVELILYRPGSTEPLEVARAEPERASGRVSVDLRRWGLESAEIEARLDRNGETIGLAKNFLEADPLPAPFPEGFRVPLVVDVPEGPALDVPWPLTAGVPFPPGALWETGGWQVEDGDRNTYPTRLEVTGTWAPDGPVKWLRVDTVAPPGEPLFLAKRPDVAHREPDDPVRVEETADGTVFLSTAGMTWEISADTSPVRIIRRGEKVIADARNTRGLYLVDQRGRLAVASAEDAEVLVEARGPVAACVRLEGYYRVVSGGADHGEPVARHITRVEMSAGQPYARLIHTLVITRDTNETWFREAGWEFEIEPGSNPAALFALSREDPAAFRALAAPGPGEEAFLVQESYFRFGAGEKRFSLSLPGEDAIPGEEMGDWFMLEGDAAGLMISCRESARQHPKEFAVSAGRMNLKLFSGRTGEELDFRAQTLVEKWNLREWYRAYFTEERTEELLENVKNIHSDAAGWAKTHEILLSPAATRRGPGPAAALSRRHSRPVFMLAEPRWIYRSEAMGPLHPRDPKRFPEAERLIDEAFDFFATRGEKFGLWGFVDYHSGPTLRNVTETRPPGLFRWNYTYTLRHDLWRVFARSGTRAAFDFATGSNRAFADNYLASADGADKRKGLFVGRTSSEPDNPACLPFYWGASTSLNWMHNTNLDQFLWDYHLTGWRRAGDQVRDFAEAARETWSPRLRDWEFYIFTSFRALLQGYGFTWDPDLGELVENLLDSIEDPESVLGLTKERVYRSTTYKSGTDPIRALLDAREILGDPRSDALLRKMADYLWQVRLGTENITYTNPKGIVGNYLYGETGRPDIAQELLVAMRWASSELDREAGGHGIAPGAHAGTFIFEGIPAIQDVLVRSGADRLPTASWAGAADFGYPLGFAFFKRDLDTVGLSLKSPQPEGVSLGGPRLELVKPASPYGPELVSTVQAPGYGFWMVPRDTPETAARIETAGTGHHHALAWGKPGLVVHAPGYWVPWPPQEPPVRWYFRVPEESREAAVFFEGRTRLYTPEGRLWKETGSAAGWVNLPGDRPGLWSFEPVENRLVKVRNLPPFFAAERPGSWFDPGIEWSAREDPGPPGDPPGASGFVEGVGGGTGLYIRPGDRFTFPGGEILEGGRGTDFLPFHEGTIEFWMKPLDWDTFNMPGDPRAGRTRKAIMRMNSGRRPWELHYYMDYTTPHREWTHSLVFDAQAAGDGREIFFRNFRYQTIIEPGEWVHVALTWGPRPRATRWGRLEILSMMVYINGRAGSYRRYGAHTDAHAGWLPADRPLEMVFPGLGGVVDHLRVSDTIRYEGDFEPSWLPPEIDRHTRAYFSFENTLEGISGDGRPVTGSIEP